MERGHRDDIDPDLLDDLRDIRVAKYLGGGVSPLDVRYRLPAHWVASSLIALEAEGLIREEHERKARSNQRRSRR